MIMGKRVKLTERQIKLIESVTEDASDELGVLIKDLGNPCDYVKKAQNESINRMKKLKITEEQLAKVVQYLKEGEGHPVMGDGSEYEPQSEKENQKSMKSFQESINPYEKEEKTQFSLRELGEAIKSTLQDIAANERITKLNPIFHKLGLTQHDLLSQFSDYNLIDYKDGEIKGVNSSANIKVRIKRAAENLKEIEIGDERMADVDEANVNVPDPSDALPQAPFNQDIQTTEPEEVNSEFRPIFMNKEIVILSKENDGLYAFWYNDLNMEDLEPHIKIPKAFKGYNEDGEPAFDYDYDSAKITATVIADYVNKHINSLTKGEGEKDWENNVELVKVDGELANHFIQHYNSQGLADIFGSNLDENTMAAGSSGAFVGPLNAPTIKRKIGVDEGKKIIKKDGTAIKQLKGKYDYRPSDSKIKRCRLCEHYILGGKCKIMRSGTVRGKIDPNYVCDVFETKDVDETTTSASSGAYVTPKVWAKDKDSWKNSKKPMYPGGTILEALHQLAEEKSNQTSTAYPSGGFVEFDDCTKLNNNTDAQEGGCSVGAVDNVAKVKTTKDSIISKEGKFNTGN